jgi:hypothetical protein
MANYVETIILQINGVDVDDVIVELTEDTDVPTKAVNTMNRARRPKGFKQGNLTFGLSLTVEESDNPKMPQWRAMLAQRTPFNIVKKPNVGKNVTWSGCRVTKVSGKNSDGDSGSTVSVMALDRKES